MTYFERGMEHYDDGKYFSAIRCFSEEISKRPYNLRAYYYRGKSYYMRRNFNIEKAVESAVKNFEKVIELVPEYNNIAHNSIRELNEILRKTGSPDYGATAHSLIKSILKILPSPKNISSDKLDQLINSGRLKEIEEITEKVKIELIDSEARVVLKKIYDILSQYKTKKYDFDPVKYRQEELSVLDKTIISSPDNTDAYFNRGFYKIKAKQYDSAIADFAKIIKLEPRNVKAYNLRSFCEYFYKNNYDEARKGYRELIKNFETEDRSTRAAAHFKIGYCYHREGKSREAIAEFNEALSLNKNLAAVPFFRKEAYKRLNEHAQVLNDYSILINLHSNHSKAFFCYGRGLYYIKLNQHKNAAKDFTEAIKLNQDYTEAYEKRCSCYENLGQYYKEKHEYKRALEYLEKASEDKNKVINLKYIVV